ncbi:MAG: hypothetical protein M0C28_22015 [Candidatus Moduliflexus flocculans]|nr:hypothetical protein [Candidatus Moduliflexus flocculans]
MLAPFRASEEARRDLVLEYRAPGREEPPGGGARPGVGNPRRPGGGPEFFGFEVLSWEDLRELRGLLRSDEGRGAFSDAFSRYSGVLGYDTDGDGLFETRTEFQGGQIASWTLDFDQNGIPELALKFRDSLPASGRMALVGAETVFEYGEYPFLARALYRTPKGVREYLFSPDALAFPAVELYSGPGRGPGKGSRHGGPGPRSLPRRPAPPPPSGSPNVRTAAEPP